jgi:hypothetical protein
MPKKTAKTKKSRGSTQGVIFTIGKLQTTDHPIIKELARQLEDAQKIRNGKVQTTLNPEILDLVRQIDKMKKQKKQLKKKNK